MIKSDVVRLNKNTMIYTPYGPDKYPDQNYEYIGRKIMVRYMCDRLDHLFERNKPNEEYLKPIFKVLRWDMDEELGKVVLVNEYQDVLVTSVAEIMTHRWYRKTAYDDICFLISDEERATMTEEEFNIRIYSKEKVYRKSVDSEWVKFNILDTIQIELEKDKFKKEEEPSMEVDNTIGGDDEDEGGDTPDSRKRRGEPIVENEDSAVNYPFRAYLNGYLIKDDMDGIAVAYDYPDETLGHVYRVLTDTEANFYANHNENSFHKLRDKYYIEGLGGRINLWQ